MPFERQDWGGSVQRPKVNRWPIAVQSAETLHGSLVLCGPGVRSVGWPDTPLVRLAALAPWSEGKLLAVRMTAAWVWGAARGPGSVLEFSTRARKRPETQSRIEMHVHQYDYNEDSLVTLGDFMVTSPEQTVRDLLRDPQEFVRDRQIACRLLLLRDLTSRVRVRHEIEAGRLQYRAMALRRLAGV